MNSFDYECRVIYRDTDQMGVSYYANYLGWFEAARTEYFRALGVPYTECEKKGYFLPVIEAHVRYLAPSHYDDLLLVRTAVSQMKRSSIRFEYQVFNKANQKLLVTGSTAHAFVDRAMHPVRIPEEIEKSVSLCKLLGK